MMGRSGTLDGFCDRHRPDAFRRHRRYVLTAAPLVLDDVLDVGSPPAAVVANTPGVLEAGPPTAVVLDLHRAGRVKAALVDQSNRHSTGVAGASQSIPGSSTRVTCRDAPETRRRPSAIVVT